LRGGKYSFLEGGIRANSFASGGMLPPAVRGTVSFALMHVADWYATYATMAGVDPNDAAGEAAGVPAIDGFNVLPLLLGDNATSPRTEIFFTKDCLMKGDWKLLRSKTSSASWPGPTYPNASTAADNNTLNNYNLDCSGNAPCLFNVAADMTEHNNVAAANPAIVTKMLARLAQLTPSIWDNKWTGYQKTCIPKQDAYDLHSGFIGPFCDLGPLPPSPPPPPPPSPGPYPPSPLNNCTYIADTFIFPTDHTTVDASTQAACCSACGMNPECVAGVLTCPNDGGSPCNCNLKLYNPKYTLAKNNNKVHSTLTCLTGRQNITATSVNS